jgi:hypothetical protein
MRNIFAAAIVSACLTAGCAGAPAAPPVDPRPAARAAVDVAKDAWVVAANACIAAVQSGAGDAVQQVCSKNLDQAHDLIVVAATAVSTGWNSNAACDLAEGAKLLVAVSNSLSSADVAAVVSDAAVVAQGLAGGACKADGG